LLRIADALSLWLDGETITLEMALGLTNTWRSAMRRRRRDELYDEIAATRFPNLGGWALARAIDSLISRYAAGAWLRDRVIVPSALTPLPAELATPAANVGPQWNF
jgi:hypothetical protein